MNEVHGSHRHAERNSRGRPEKWVRKEMSGGVRGVGVESRWTVASRLENLEGEAGTTERLKQR